MILSSERTTAVLILNYGTKAIRFNVSNIHLSSDFINASIVHSKQLARIEILKWNSSIDIVSEELRVLAKIPYTDSIHLVEIPLSEKDKVNELVHNYEHRNSIIEGVWSYEMPNLRL